jgi:antitoxin component of RelBE/YafQ-DinJ toxin-antitoxin module
MAKKSVTISVRLDENLKSLVKAKANQLGLNLSQVVQNELRKFVQRGNVRITRAPSSRVQNKLR